MTSSAVSNSGHVRQSYNGPAWLDKPLSLTTEQISLGEHMVACT